MGTSSTVTISRVFHYAMFDDPGGYGFQSKKTRKVATVSSSFKKNYPPILTGSNVAMGNSWRLYIVGKSSMNRQFLISTFTRELAWICLVSIGFDQKLDRPQYLV